MQGASSLTRHNIWCRWHGSVQVVTFLIWKYFGDCLWMATYFYESFEKSYLKEMYFSRRRKKHEQLVRQSENHVLPSENQDT